MSNISNQAIFDEAKNYLLGFVGEEILEKHLRLGEKSKPDTISLLYNGLLSSLSNRQGIGNSIGPIENLRSYLFDFNPQEVVANFGKDWKRLFKTIESSYDPPTKMDITKNGSYWVIFTRGIISGANFLARFQSIEDFNEFVNHFYLNDIIRAALPMLLAAEIYGLGFATACDFLKENGYPEYVKPDVHIKDVFLGLGITSTKNDYEVFKEVTRFAKTIDETPYAVDKLFWLIGSGRFYLDDIKVNTNKGKFIQRILKLMESIKLE